MYNMCLSSCLLTQCVTSLVRRPRNGIKATACSRCAFTVPRQLVAKSGNAISAPAPRNSCDHGVDKHHSFNSKQFMDRETTGGSVDDGSPTYSRLKLEKKLQARLRDKSRARDVKSLKDPLVQHLLRVASSPPYRKAHGSIIVSSGRLVTELTTNFQCKRLIVRRQSPSSIWKKSPHLFTTRPVVDKHGEAGDTGSAWTSGIGGPTRKSQNSLNQNIQVHCVSNRILKKVAGLHSYDDGCIAEMRLPEPTSSFGNIRLLLCIGSISDGFNRLESRAFESGAAGTLIRTAGALHWQGIWILPSCADVFNPLGVRASQGALFWLPYHFGNLEELQSFCRKQGLAICVPGFPGSSSVPLNTPELFSTMGYKGVCLLIDSFVANAMRERQCGAATRDVASADLTGTQEDRVGIESRVFRKFQDSIAGFSSDLLISLDERIVPLDKLKWLHPTTVASLMLYYIKKTHFPSTTGSAYVYTIPKRGGA